MSTAWCSSCEWPGCERTSNIILIHQILLPFRVHVINFTNTNLISHLRPFPVFILIAGAYFLHHICRKQAFRVFCRPFTITFHMLQGILCFDLNFIFNLHGVYVYWVDSFQSQCVSYCAAIPWLMTWFCRIILLYICGFIRGISSWLYLRPLHRVPWEMILFSV